MKDLTTPDSVKEILAFAEEIKKQSDEIIARWEAWNEFITPLFFKDFGKKYDDSLRTMYAQQEWIKAKQEIFNANY